jgi:hypothetical protein
VYRKEYISEADDYWQRLSISLNLSIPSVYGYLREHPRKSDGNFYT